MRVNKINGLIKKQSKDGSVIIFSLFIMIMIFSISALLMLFINMFYSMEKAESAVETVANTRTQAIDVLLKEELGYIEVLNNNYTGANYQRFKEILEEDGANNLFTVLDSKRSNTATAGYDYAMLKKDQGDYLSAVSAANDAALDSGIKQLLHQFPHAGDTSDTPMGNVDKNNFCIDIFPLPKNNKKVNSSSNTIEVGCTVTLNNENIEIFPDDIKINGRDNDLNNPYKDAGTDIENKKLNVINGVFVGFAYEDTNNVFYKAFKGMTKNTGLEMEPPIRTIYKIAYPQIDAHSFGSYDSWNN